MKKNFLNSAALVAAAAGIISLGSCSGDELAYFKSPSLNLSFVTLNFDIQNGCPTATAEGTVKDQDSTLVAYGDLSVTLAEEQIAIPGDQDFGTAYSNGDWETGFEYTDGQYATVTWDSSDKDRFKVEDVVFNEDRTVVTPAADGMSATVTLSYTATVKYIGDSIYTAQVELNPWYTQYKVENQPAVTEPTYSYDYDSDIELVRDGGSIILTKWNITRVWNGETKVFSIPNMITVAMVPENNIDDPQTVKSLEYNDYGVKVGDAKVAEKQFGNFTRVSETRSVTAELHMTSPAGGDLKTIGDNLNMMSSVITFTDPETGYSLSVDMTLDVADHKVSFVDRGLGYIMLHEETVKKDYWTTLQYEVTFSSASTTVPQWNNSEFAQYIHEKNLSHGNIIE